MLIWIIDLLWKPILLSHSLTHKTLDGRPMSASFPKPTLTMEAIAIKDHFRWLKYHPLRMKQLQLIRPPLFKKNLNKKLKLRQKIKPKQKLKIRQKLRQLLKLKSKQKLNLVTTQPSSIKLLRRPRHGAKNTLQLIKSQTQNFQNLTISPTSMVSISLAQ